jgi:hypothetical protein
MKLNATLNPYNIRVSKWRIKSDANLWFIVLFAVAILFQEEKSFAKVSDSTKEWRVRNGIWYAPVGRSTTINGLALSVRPKTLKMKDSLAINGFIVDVNPLPIAVAPFMFIRLLGAAFYGDSTENSIRYTDQETLQRKNTIVKGVGISIGMIDEGEINGLSVNVTFSHLYRMKGVEISGLANLHYSFKGLMASILWNQSTVGRGVQIGLINRCKEGRVLQIGLVNRIGKRTLPFINFSFKKKKKLEQ